MTEALNPEDQREQVRDLCRQAREGDMDAGSALLALYYESMFLWFRRLCSNEHDAQDLTQKTFSKVWKTLGSFEERCSFSTWIHRIGHHVYLDWQRQKHGIEQPSDDWWESRPSDGRTPLEDATERDLARLVYALVEQLDEDSRITMHLHYYQGLSLAETADVLQVATSTVKYRVRAALNHLKSQLKHRLGTDSAAPRE